MPAQLTRSAIQNRKTAVLQITAAACSQYFFMKARKVISIRPSLFVRTIQSAAKIDWPGDTNTIPYSGQKSNWLFV